ncbi:unnamed protein product [Mytilus edulis]|uniref:YqaJ viral recombinase domain-containing protein n=1 Tax=Mytilus edulis TaxID=6550 RepID=A0A8S3T8J2_MYTED|nr:unnamed protein product [Mytilus edulis]
MRNIGEDYHLITDGAVVDQEYLFEPYNHWFISYITPFQPANPYAIAVDHDYFKLSPEDHWLKDNKLFQISDEDITSIQTITVNQSKSKQWLYERCKRLTSSNFGRICKATDRTDFHKLALSYTRSSALYTAAIKHGRQYEPVAIEKYESITKLETVKCGLFVSKMHPFLAASPDGLTENNTLLEIKCPYTARNELITPKSVPYLSEARGSAVLCTLPLNANRDVVEILQWVGPRIAKQNTFYRNPLEPGLKLAIILRHLASGAKYRQHAVRMESSA